MYWGVPGENLPSFPAEIVYQSSKTRDFSFVGRVFSHPSKRFFCSCFKRVLMYVIDFTEITSTSNSGDGNKAISRFLRSV